MTFASAAAELRQQEFARLAAFVTPRLEQLRSMKIGELHIENALMWERIGQACRSSCELTLGAHQYLTSNLDSLDLVEGDFIAGAVIELGGARALMRRHGLGVFQRTTGLEIRSNAGCPEHVATEFSF
jgi:hypothetical protein